MNINVQIDSKDLILRLDKGQKRLAYGVVNAINATARDVQAAAHEHVSRKFIIRKPVYFFGTRARPGGVAGRIRPFASVGQGRPYAEIAVTGPTAEATRRTLLPMFEEGGVRRPFTKGARSVAVPLEGRPARPSIRGPVPPQFTFQGLKFRLYKGTRKIRKADGRRGKRGEASIFGEFGAVKFDEVGEGAFQWKGKERTFILKSTKRAPHGGVFQRTGPKRGDVRMIYAFEPSVRVDSRLDFMLVAQLTANRRFPVHMEREAIKAIARARGVGL